jgi:UDP-galactopyranose mutase
MQPLIVFSHLRWDFVFQRPQHLMTRLAKHYRVFFIEEPVHDPDGPRMEVSEVLPNVNVCRPRTPLAERGFSQPQLPVVRRLVDGLLISHDIRAPLVWFYTPLALPLLQGLDPAAVVYDCMDELSAFKDAPRDLLELERALLQVADVVFTGGPSLFRSKQRLHPNVHCFPSSVEKDHFAQAADPVFDHPEQRGIPRPRFGFFGVIDERFDPVSVALLADSHPHWHISLVGPVVKIDPASLPRRPNIHYFGQRSYAELPRFLAGWDVAMMPFALNEATRYISPTKVLEYMAAGKPIVSTPVTDVAEPYGEIVHIGTHSQAFVAACERALNEPAPARARRSAAMRKIVDGTSWDATAEKMRALIDATRRPPKRAAKPAHRRTVVIGAGPTGLSAAYHLGKDSLLLERNGNVGGWCRSIVDKGFTFDCAGHIMFSNDPYVHELYRLLLGDNVHWQDREAWIYSKNVYTRYPFQGALHGLPPDVLKECLLGAIEARFGSLKPQAAETARKLNGHSNGHANGHSNALKRGSSPVDCKPDSITDCCADGIAESTANLIDLGANARSAGAPAYRNFEEFIYKVWGAGVARHFAIPYNRKLWAVPLTEMETSWLGGRVPLPDLEEMIDGALRPVARPQGPNARFGYPLRGGFQALMDGFLPHLRGEVKLNAEVSRIVPSRHLVELADGSRYTYDKLISTMPLPELIRAIGDEAPEAVRLAANRLRHVSVRCVNLGIGREALTDKHWIYYPENSVFHRIFVQGAASPHNNAPGGFALTCEITYSPHKPLPCDGDALIERCIADCIAVGIIDADDPIVARNQVDMPYAYVVYDHARAENVAVARDWLARADIELAGRYSEWEYYNSDHAFLAGKKAAERVEAALKPRAAMTATSHALSIPQSPAHPPVQSSKPLAPAAT